MKTLILTIAGALFLLTGNTALAQLSGKRFISGFALLNFGNTKPETGSTSNNYGLGFDAQFGKFRTENLASGWRLAGSFNGAKHSFWVIPDQTAIEVQKQGLRDLKIGGGYFWQRYKHFDNKLSAWAGAGIDVSYGWNKNYEAERGLLETVTNSVALSAGLSAGLAYRFSDRWWARANIAFSDPVSLKYALQTREYTMTDIDISNPRTNTFEYRLTPQFSFPSVGIGLLYFPSRR